MDGDDRLEGRLAELAETALRGVQRIIPPDCLQALWLGGGYGRGEGGVLRLPGGDWPYNDLEFYIGVRGNRLLNGRRFGLRLHRLAEAMGPPAGIEVEFQVVSLPWLQRAPPSMFFYDLVAGHRQLAGCHDLLKLCPQQGDPRRLPLAEATRLLLNRGTGLLLARRRLDGRSVGADDADFIGRNVAKAELALGDAVLTALGRYHWSCLERHRRLLTLPDGEAPPWVEELRRHHAAGVEFKLHPTRSRLDPERLCDDHARVTAFMAPVWLWVERRRLGIEFLSIRDYVSSTVNKWPETGGWRNLMLNIWMHGPAAFLRLGSRRHPRERALTTLATLLWGQQEPHCGLPGGSPEPSAPPSQQDSLALMEGYRKLWERVR